jgi:hypothetical protein
MPDGPSRRADSIFATRWPGTSRRSIATLNVATALAALYLNVFIGVVPSFQKLAFLKALAPTQSEPPFLVEQILVLGLFIVLGIVAAKRFHPLPA